MYPHIRLSGQFLSDMHAKAPWYCAMSTSIILSVNTCGYVNLRQLELLHHTSLCLCLCLLPSIVILNSQFDAMDEFSGKHLRAFGFVVFLSFCLFVFFEDDDDV